MLKARLLTAAVALPAVLAAVLFLPACGFSLFIAVLGAWGLYEIAEMTATGSPAQRSAIFLLSFGLGGACLAALLIDSKSPLIRGLLFVLSLGGVLLWPCDESFRRAREHRVGEASVLLALFLVAALMTAFIAGPELFPAAAVILAMAALVLMVAAMGPTSGPHGVALALLGAVSVGVLFPYFALLRNAPHGIELVILMLLLVVSADSGAYFVGRAIGRHKLAFRVSPGKTLEGAAGAVAVTIIAGLILNRWLQLEWKTTAVVVYSACVAVLAIVGDLANSAFKRIAGVKDSGWIFPGHGGLLDRTCSLVLAAVLTYYYSR